MKTLIKKFILILVVGVAVALFLYPALHELGHIFSAILLGGKIEQVSFFPVQRVLCNTGFLSQKKQIIIGLSGGLLPIVISLISYPKRFLIWYANTLIKLINIYCLLLFSIYAIAFHLGYSFKNNDITTILSLSPSLSSCVFIGCFLLIFVLILSIKHSKPIVFTMNYFS